MSAFLTASLVFALLVSSFSVSAGQRIITAEPGDNVILPCRAAENKDVKAVEWSRADLESGQFVFLYRDNTLITKGQSPSFKDRVDLLDVENGDVSLVLKNVKTNDTGRYKCRVDYAKNNRRKRSSDTETISIIPLIVEAGNKENGRSWPGLIVGLSVCAVVALLLVGAVLYKRSREKLSTHQHGGFFSAAVRDF